MAQIKLGPWSSPPKSGFWGSLFQHSGYDDIKFIQVTHRLFINYIGVQYMKGNHLVNKQIGPPIPFPDEYKTDEIELDYPKEYLVKIEGSCGYDGDKPVISLLTFVSNKKVYGPFGEKGETPFVLKMEGAKIVGFHGSYYPNISLLGVFVKPYGAPRSTFPAYNPGPLGAGRGEPWDDGIFTRINKVVVNVDDDDGSVISLQTFYELDGSSYSTLHPAGKTGGSPRTVDFNEHGENLIRISGFFGPLEGYPDIVAVKALRFYTNRKYEDGYGPFGNESGMGEFFSTSTEEGEILGFHGRSGARLNAIGAHIKYANHT